MGFYNGAGNDCLEVLSMRKNSVARHRIVKKNLYWRDVSLSVNLESIPNLSSHTVLLLGTGAGLHC